MSYPNLPMRKECVVSRRSILVVDDAPGHRKMLQKILGQDYRIFECTNGREALAFLQETTEEISLILLDLLMPIMDGYTFMEAIGKNERLRGIPIIVETASGKLEDELRCLAAGASDFIPKPYNSEIIRRRISSIIRLRETSAMLNLLQYDKPTGFFTKEFFYRNIEQELRDHPAQDFDIVCSNIENFKFINERYGIKKGDQLLQFMADIYRKYDRGGSIFGYFGSDKFFSFSKHWSSFNPYFFDVVCKDIKENAPVPNVVVKFSIYQQVDRAMPVPTMCDKALLALDRIKKAYGKSVAKYDTSLDAKLLREQNILNAMEEGIREHQFVVYYQPKYDIRLECISGMEALVRWEHPSYGMLPPSEFIPLFEQNGFITALDFYVWEETLKTLQKWITQDMPIFPISVNVSLSDLSLPHFTEKLHDLVQRYHVSPSLLHLEITESAYSENPDEIIETVNRLRLLGFKIEMDDFGSGYSSLNMLSELPIDILKLDMSFLQKKPSLQKKNVMSFVLSLARWLEMGTVAEGVETKSQLEALKAMGCRQIQGYYYAKPMPLQEVEAHIRKSIACHPTEPPELPGHYEDIFPDFTTDTILLACDTEADCAYLRLLLEPQYQIVEASNGQEVLDYLRLHPREIALILLSLFMPTMGGLETLERLKAEEDFAQIPIGIILDIDLDHGAHALNLGADTLVFKPFRKDYVLHSVKNAINGAQLQKIKESIAFRKNQLRHAAYQDSLTNCYNRRGLTESIRRLPKDEKHTVMLIDMDNLKKCNDTHGHGEGDKLIQTIVATLNNEIRSDDILARIGGDEFVLVIKNLSDPELAFRKAQHLTEVVKHLTLDSIHFPTSCSIGLAIMPDIAMFDAVLKRADEALYRVKKTQKGTCALWGHTYAD